MTNPVDGSGRAGNNALQEAQGNRKSQQGQAATERNEQQATQGSGQEITTAESERLQSVREAVDQTPQVDQGRVDAIREQVANGEYPLDAQSIADRFAELEGLLESE
ncbi:MAG: flagellar biosynthesis anti-sigma factor FlgM [Ectothiorhodospiraceae bacterium]